MKLPWSQSNRKNTARSRTPIVSRPLPPSGDEASAFNDRGAMISMKRLGANSRIWHLDCAGRCCAESLSGWTDHRRIPNHPPTVPCANGRYNQLDYLVKAVLRKRESPLSHSVSKCDSRASVSLRNYTGICLAGKSK